MPHENQLHSRPIPPLPTTRRNSFVVQLPRDRVGAEAPRVWFIRQAIRQPSRPPRTGCAPRPKSFPWNLRHESPLMTARGLQDPPTLFRHVDIDVTALQATYDEIIGHVTGTEPLTGVAAASEDVNSDLVTDAADSLPSKWYDQSRLPHSCGIVGMVPSRVASPYFTFAGPCCDIARLR